MKNVLIDQILGAKSHFKRFKPNLIVTVAFEFRHYLGNVNIDVT